MPPEPTLTAFTTLIPARLIVALWFPQAGAVTSGDRHCGRVTNVTHKLRRNNYNGWIGVDVTPGLHLSAEIAN